MGFSCREADCALQVDIDTDKENHRQAENNNWHLLILCRFPSSVKQSSIDSHCCLEGSLDEDHAASKKKRRKKRRELESLFMVLLLSKNLRKLPPTPENFWKSPKTSENPLRNYILY